MDSLFHAAGRSRLFVGAAFLLLGLSCAAVWVFPFFPSQDGPSHSYNAAIMARYEEEPAWREYFLVRGSGIGASLVSHLPLGWMLPWMPAPVAEKLLVIVLVVFFCLSFLYLLASVGTQAGPFVPFAVMAAFNYHLYMGFWSFYASLAAMNWVAGYLIRALHRQCWRCRDLVILAVGGAATYACHVAGWLILFAAASSLCTCRVLENALRGIPCRLGCRVALPLLCLLPPAAAVAAQLDWSAAPEGYIATVSLKSRLWALYSLSPLTALHWDEAPAVKVLAFGLLGALLVVAASSIRRRNLPPGAGLLGAAAVLAGLGLFLPDAFGGGGFIRERFILPAILFLVAWLAGALPPRPRWVGACVFAALVAAWALSWTYRLPRIAQFNKALEDYARVTSVIPRGAAVLPIGPPAPGLRVDPFIHAVSHACIRGAVNLGNYEANRVGFAVRFRPGRNPLPALWTESDQLQSPPRFDIRRYERITGGKVDFVLLRAAPDTGGISIPPGLEEFRPVEGQASPFLLLLQRAVPRPPPQTAPRPVQRDVSQPVRNP